MLNEHYDVTTAAYAVGYESLSHFSREYLRMFGESPKRDITRFSMQGKKENTLRIINATNHQLPGDRESLFWVNVKAIPAMEKDQKNENTLQLAIISRIKMFYRPTNLAMAPEEAPAMLRFRRSGSKLTLINPTPYFITVTNMKAGNSNLPNTMVPPKGEVSVDIPHAATGDISFQTINDYGALTPRIKATMQ